MNPTIMSIKVAIVEDNRSFRDKLSTYLNDTENYNCIGAYDSAEDAVKYIPKLLPGIFFIYIHLPDMAGID